MAVSYLFVNSLLQIVQRHFENPDVCRGQPAVLWLPSPHRNRYNFNRVDDPGYPLLYRYSAYCLAERLPGMHYHERKQEANKYRNRVSSR